MESSKGEITLIASLFTNTKDWFDLDQKEYVDKKKDYLKKISVALESQFEIASENWLHKEFITCRFSKMD